MATLRKKILLLILVTLLGITVSVFLSIIGINKLLLNEYIRFLLYFLMSITFISTIILIQIYKNFIVAEVIIENQILHIMSAYPLVAGSYEKTSSFSDSIEIYISNFGILLDSKIVKYNQGGDQLKAVEIGRYYISLTYGTFEHTKTMWLLHAEFDSGELKKITERFRFETGIIPEIVI